MPACCVNIKRPWSQRYHVSQHSCPEMPKACGSIPPPLGCRRLPGTSLLTGISSRPECQLKRRCGERAAHRTNWIWTGVASLASFRPVGNLAALAWCKAPPLRSAQPQLDSQRCWQFHPCRPREWPPDLEVKGWLGFSPRCGMKISRWRVCWRKAVGFAPPPHAQNKHKETRRVWPTLRQGEGAGTSQEGLVQPRARNTGLACTLELLGVCVCVCLSLKQG